MGGRVRIFIVDDEQIISRTLALILNNAGYEAVGFTSSVEALQASRELQPDILLSDIMMPQMNGLELARALRAHAPACQVILLSGNTAAADLLDEAERSGSSYRVLPKPIHPEDLLARLAQIAASIGRNAG